MEGSIICQLFTGNRQQGSKQLALRQRPSRRHARETGGTGAAQQAQEESLHLVIQVVRQQQHIVRFNKLFEDAVARIPGGGFRSLALFSYLYLTNFQGNTQIITKFLAKFSPGVGLFAELVVNMYRQQWRDSFRVSQFTQQL